MRRLCVEVSPLCAFDEKSLGNQSAICGVKNTNCSAAENIIYFFMYGMCMKKEEKPHYLRDVISTGGLSVFLLSFFFVILPGTAIRGQRNEKIILWRSEFSSGTTVIFFFRCYVATSAFCLLQVSF